MRVIKPGTAQTRPLWFGTGTCPRCGCEVELEGHELWLRWCPLDRRNYPYNTNMTCPTKGCPGLITVDYFTQREVPYE